MNSALIVGASQELYKTIHDVLALSDFESIEGAGDLRRAEELVSSLDVDLVFIHAPSPLRAELEFAARISERPDMAVVMLVRQSMVASTERALVKTKTLVLGMPISRQALIQSIKLAGSLTYKFTQIQKETDKLKKKIEDLKVLDRAKCCLVAFLRMNEEQAHRYIQKRAMDMRVSQREVAEDILKTYEY